MHVQVQTRLDYTHRNLHNSRPDLRQYCSGWRRLAGTGHHCCYYCCCLRCCNARSAARTIQKLPGCTLSWQDRSFYTYPQQYPGRSYRKSSAHTRLHCKGCRSLRSCSNIPCMKVLLSRRSSCSRTHCGILYSRCSGYCCRNSSTAARTIQKLPGCTLSWQGRSTGTYSRHCLGRAHRRSLVRTVPYRKGCRLDRMLQSSCSMIGLQCHRSSCNRKRHNMLRKNSALARLVLLPRRVWQRAWCGTRRCATWCSVYFRQKGRG